MAARLQWWVFPGAVFVLAHVVTLTPRRGDTDPPAAAAREALATARPTVAEASGMRLPGALLEAARAEALVLQVPATFAGERGVMTVWRRIDGRREREPWLSLRPRVRSAATIPLVGLPAGHYDVELTLGRGATALQFAADAVPAPGTLPFVDPAPGR